jgi:acyl-CoA reductase-like NAD-dependent aldehyde dehydrogenase
VFGPVVTIAAFDDDEDAIRSANDTSLVMVSSASRSSSRRMGGALPV